MKKAAETDLVTLGAIFDDFIAKFDKMSEADKIDLAARLKPVAKACKTIDDKVKDIVKVKLNHQEGDVLGGLFKAVLKLISATRFQSAAFKEAKPAMYAQWCTTDDEERVTFELR